MGNALALLKPTQRPSRPVRGDVAFGVGQGTPGLLPAAVPDTQEQRAKIWNIDASLHCSIIGTCLTAAELRVLAERYGPGHASTFTDHEIHGTAVRAISERGLLAKQIQKALDRRHARWVRRASEMTASELGRAWEAAMRAGDIPSAYWAMLTHPAATGDLVRRIFGDVHMLSHLVGTANRADIRRLQQLEGEKARLEDKLARQQARLRDDISTRDAQIRQLSDLLAACMSDRAAPAAADRHDSEARVLETLVARLHKELEGEMRRRERAEARAKVLGEARMESDRRVRRLESEMDALRRELEAAEHALAPSADRYGEDTGLIGVHARCCSMSAAGRR